VGNLTFTFRMLTYRFTKFLIAGLVCVICSIGDVLAQDPQFTQFYANPLYLNPAFAGTANCPRAILNYRNQWPGIPGTYITTNASYDQHIDAISGGIGLMVMNDKAGEGTLNTTRVSGIYSYQQAITRNFSIKVGFEATYFQRSLDWDNLTFGDMIDERKGFIYQTQDVPRGGNVSNVDFSAGFLGYSEKFYFGFAAHHLTQPDESVINDNSPLPIKFTGHAGYSINIKEKKYSQNNKSSLSPGILYQRQASFQQLLLGLYVKKGPLVGGVWYRNKDSFIALLGLQTGSMKIGYSYDVTVSRLTTATGGSHELSLALQLDCKPKKRRFRAISCPAF
jgi:type IX secretion system PorP/SprF family membrane protein